MPHDGGVVDFIKTDSQKEQANRHNQTLRHNRMPVQNNL